MKTNPVKSLCTSCAHSCFTLYCLQAPKNPITSCNSFTPIKHHNFCLNCWEDVSYHTGINYYCDCGFTLVFVNNQVTYQFSPPHTAGLQLVSADVPIGTLLILKELPL